MIGKLHFHIERWKWNKEYQMYVSTDGNLRDAGKVDVKPYINGGGYFFVETPIGKRAVHKIVAETWLGKKVGMTIDHKNSNKRDNSVRNLEWVSKEENWDRAVKVVSRDCIDDLIQSACDKGLTVGDIMSAIQDLSKHKDKIVAKTAKEWFNKFAAKYPNKLNGLTASKAEKQINLAAASRKKYLGFLMKRTKDGIEGVA